MNIKVTDIVSLGPTCENHALRLEMTFGANVVHLSMPKKDVFLNADPSDEISIISNAGDVKERAIFAGLVRVRSYVKENHANSTANQIRAALISETGFKI